ncbi:Crp/Fnr family transcriptional regulator [Actinorugispora endophytica]|uniref:CRP-like cAMP-binding protein n=1 Tax=Actinorugispora endophytica TaxID=1605990 RepID=A0A4R6UKA4_9ACTN|nr:cyclic nucleotide-binding domain-containing protein [Actinorugispora endophytica]TDQ46566.1 CRP-like cAMP-binding protein [Actinorugispora endophytica]
MERNGFGGFLADDQWDRLVRAGNRYAHEEGAFLLRQGEPGRTVHLLLSGQVKVSLLRPDGALALLALRGRGEALGEMSVVTGQPRTTTVTALRGCRTSVLPAERFVSLISGMELYPFLTRHLVARQKESDERRAEQTSLPAGRLLAMALLRLAELGGEETAEVTSDPRGPRRGMVLRLGLAQKELGELVGLSRTAVALEFTRFRERGLVRTGRRFVAILDMAGLEAIAHGE